jgi:hypothetical protein
MQGSLSTLASDKDPIIYCDVCNENPHFRTQTVRLVHHRRLDDWIHASNHGPVRMPSDCDICGGPMAKAFELIPEPRAESASRFVLKCRRCGKTYDRSERLLAHSVCHTNKKPYQCPLCPQMFTRGTTIHIHMSRFHKSSSSSSSRMKSFDVLALDDDSVGQDTPTPFLPSPREEEKEEEEDHEQQHQ